MNLAEVFQISWERSRTGTGKLYAALQVAELLDPRLDAATITAEVAAADDTDLLETALGNAMLIALDLALRRIDQLEGQAGRLRCVPADLNQAVELLIAVPAGTA